MSTPPVNAPALVLEDDPRLADTGWVPLDFLNGWTASGHPSSTTPAYRRVGRTVFIRMRNLNGVAATANAVAQLPYGLWPPSADGGLVMIGGNVRVAQVGSTGLLSIVNAAGRDGVGAATTISYLTEQGLPT